MPEVVTIVLKVGMHCEGCARKVKKSLSSLSGLEELKVEYDAQKVTIKGTIDPNKALEKLSKIGKLGEVLQMNVEPQKQMAEDKKEASKPPQIQTIVLKAMLHCEGCGRKVKDAIKKVPGVQEVTINFQQQKLLVKGSFDVKKVLEKALKTGKHVELCAPEMPKDAPKENKGASTEEKKDASKGGGKKEAPKGDIKDSLKEGKQEASKVDKVGGPIGEKKDTPKDNKQNGLKDVNKGEEEMHKEPKKETAKEDGNAAPKEDKGKPKNAKDFSNSDMKKDSKTEKRDASKDGKKEEPKWVVEDFVSPYMPYRCDDATQLFSEDNPNACIIM